ATCEGKGETTYTATFVNDAFATQTKTVDNIDATGHAYGEPTYVWAEDNSTVTATAVCGNDESHVATETVNTTSNTTSATCEADGQTVYTAEFENDLFKTQSKTVVLPAIGHNYGEPTYVWAEDNSTVTATRVCANDASHAETETVETTSAVTTPATCETDGVETFTSAAFENEAFTIQTKEVAISATGHAYGEPTYNWAEDNSTVTATRVCANDPSHVETETANTTSEVTKPATCEEKGETTYTAIFANDAFATQTKTVDNIDATGHDWQFVELTWEGNDAEGYTATASYKCKNNEEHNRTVAAAMATETTDATCTVAGTVTYVATITESAAPDGVERTDSKVVTGQPLGHDYELTGWNWAEDLSTASAVFTCTRDASHVQTVDAEMSVTTTPATCDKAGSIVHVATVTFEDKPYTNSRSEELAALGHAYGTPTYEWTEDNSTVTATRVCANDPSHVETETVNTTSEVTKPATCESKGETTYTATFTNDAFATQTKTIDNIDAVGHNYGEPTYVWAEDNSTVTATRVCANDTSHVETETVETTSAVTTPATCEEAGVETFTSAAFENEAFAVQTKEVEISATGHAYGAATYVWAEDNSSVTATRVCANDPSHVETETVTATSEVTTSATCEEAGVETFTSATFENEAFTIQTKEVAISATGHAYGEPSYEWAEDNSSVTATRVCANDPLHVETETANTTSEVTKPATCEGKGETTYTATFVNDAFATQTKTVDNIDATGHAYGEPT
ncbi:MAG: hypothetical protein IKD75_04505, partial [Prevotella sp.]|nr:hypothetical protein [Prevotella sp.]